MPQLYNKLEKYHNKIKGLLNLDQLIEDLCKQNIMNDIEKRNILKSANTKQMQDVFDIVEEKQSVHLFVDILRKEERLGIIADYVECANSKFRVELEDQTVFEGEDVTLFCELDINGPAVKWKKNNDDIHGPNLIYEDDKHFHRLIIKNACSKDSGIYSCNICDLNKTECKVDVLENVEFEQPPKNQNVELKQMAVFKVQLRKPSNMKTEWFKNTMLLKESKKYSMRNDEFCRSLHVYEVVENDKGRYICKIGKKSTEAQLTVQDIQPAILAQNPESALFEATESLKKKDEEIADLTAKLKSLQGEYDKVKRDNTFLKLKISQLEKDLKQLQVDKEELKRKVSYLEQIVNDLRRRNEELINCFTQHIEASRERDRTEQEERSRERAEKDQRHQELLTKVEGIEKRLEKDKCKIA